MTPSNASLAESIASLPALERRKILATLTPAEAERLAHEWRFWARANQLAPNGTWAVWLLASDDPDGGRHPVGAVLLVGAVFCGTLGLVLLRRSRRS